MKFTDYKYYDYYDYSYTTNDHDPKSIFGDVDDYFAEIDKLDKDTKAKDKDGTEIPDFSYSKNDIPSANTITKQMHATDDDIITDTLASTDLTKLVNATKAYEDNTASFDIRTGKQLYFNNLFANNLNEILTTDIRNIQTFIRNSTL